MFFHDNDNIQQVPKMVWESEELRGLGVTKISLLVQSCPFPQRGHTLGEQQKTWLLFFQAHISGMLTNYFHYFYLLKLSSQNGTKLKVAVSCYENWDQLTLPPIATKHQGNMYG